MIDSSILATARSAFAALDFSADNDRIAVLEAERERIEVAINAGEQRTREISAEVAMFIRPNPGEAIADALLDNTSPSDAATAAPGRDALIEERARLNSGIAELKRRDGGTYAAIRAVQQEATGKAGKAAAPLIAALEGEARAAAQRLADAFAALDAVSSATRHGNRERDLIGQAVGRLSGPGGLLTARTVRVPAAIIDALQGLEGKGAALQIGVREFATVPQDTLVTSMVAAAFGRQNAA